MKSDQQKKSRAGIYVALAFLALLVIIFIPTPASLPVAGKYSLAVLVFAVILWMTEAVSYPVSAVMIGGLISLLIGISPTIEDPSVTFGTTEALKLSLSGFSSSAVALVGAALFLAAAMEATGLHKRIALFILSKVGSKTASLIFGTILVSIILAFFVPSATARGGALVPILLGMVAAFGLAKENKLSALLVITAVQSISIWNIGIKTAAAQNMVALGFIEESFKISFSWSEWFIYAAPFSVIMSIFLALLMPRVIKMDGVQGMGGKESLTAKLEELGPMTKKEWRLVAISLLLLFFWSTESYLHSFDTTTVTIIAVGLLLAPKIGVFTWKEVEGHIPWGTIIVFAIGISLGTTLLQTKGASWLVDSLVSNLGLESMPLVVTIGIVTLFNIVVHLGFASATGLSSALIPIIIALVSAVNLGVDEPGFVLIQQFVVSFGFLLPVNAPQNMLAYGTGTFTTKDFLKSGIPLTVFGYLLILIFSMTYWKWVGLL